MKAPAPAPEASVTLPRSAPTDTVVFRHVIDYGDGMPEVVSVTVKSASTRAALLAGELTKAALKDLEAEQALDTLRLLNPQAAQEYELAMMREAHNSDKGKRASVSRQRNAEARAKDEAKGIRVRRPKGKGRS